MESTPTKEHCWFEILRTNGKELQQFFQNELKLITVMMQTRVDSSVKCEDFSDKGPSDHAQGMQELRLAAAGWLGGFGTPPPPACYSKIGGNHAKIRGTG